LAGRTGEGRGDGWPATPPPPLLLLLRERVEGAGTPAAAFASVAAWLKLTGSR